VSDYYKIRKLSNSALTCLAQNPMEFKMRYVDDPPTLPPRESDAFAFGSAVHCLALEPERFDERFAIAPKVDRRTKEGKATYEAFQRFSEGKQVLDSGEYDDVIACVQALNSHADFAKIMLQPKRVEESIEFEFAGHPMKCKPDAIVDSMRLILDIKTTDDASPHKWQWSALDYGYHRQAYLYQQAIHLQTSQWYSFIFAVVQKPKPSTRGIPPTVALYEFDAETTRMALEDCTGLVLQYEDRLEKDNWQQPYSAGIVSMRLPKRRVYTEG